jgi:hypothetical protein
MCDVSATGIEQSLSHDTTSFEDKILQCVHEPCKREPSHKYVHILLFGLVVGIVIGHVTQMCAPVTNKFLHRKQTK